MRSSVSAIVILFLLFPLAALGQHGGRHGASTGTTGGTTASPEDPDLATFKHDVAVQATEEQIAQFGLMIKSTEAARQQAHDLQHANDAEGLTSRATGLQNSVEEAQRENHAFRQSLSDSQEAGLKNLTKKLTKSESAVSKDAKAISQQLEQTTLNSGRLVSAAASLEKALAALQSDQLNLGKEMGIPPH